MRATQKKEISLNKSEFFDDEDLKDLKTNLLELRLKNVFGV